mmetsp:Transcript_29778/g.79153  ORF Transcript_29778/g.79153 Transcript_29778/m.79153 type:complete len:481 (-) Transcript_29778:190-1632(-)
MAEVLFQSQLQRLSRALDECDGFLDDWSTSQHVEPEHPQHRRQGGGEAKSASVQLARGLHVPVLAARIAGRAPPALPVGAVGRNPSKDTADPREAKSCRTPRRLTPLPPHVSTPRANSAHSERLASSSCSTAPTTHSSAQKCRRPSLPPLQGVSAEGDPSNLVCSWCGEIHASGHEETCRLRQAECAHCGQRLALAMRERHQRSCVAHSRRPVTEPGGAKRNVGGASTWSEVAHQAVLDGECQKRLDGTRTMMLNCALVGDVQAQHRDAWPVGEGEDTGAMEQGSVELSEMKSLRAAMRPVAQHHTCTSKRLSSANSSTGRRAAAPRSHSTRSRRLGSRDRPRPCAISTRRGSVRDSDASSRSSMPRRVATPLSREERWTPRSSKVHCQATPRRSAAASDRSPCALASTSDKEAASSFERPSSRWFETCSGLDARGSDGTSGDVLERVPTLEELRAEMQNERLSYINHFMYSEERPGPVS